MSQPIPAPVARSGRRDVRLDALRGLFLLLMFSSHLGTPLTRLTIEPFGYVSSAEGFVFLAAFLAGIVYRKTYETKGYDAMRDKAWRRAGLIYLCHIGLLMAGFLFAYLVGETGDPVSNIFKTFYQAPLTSMGLALVLLYQPPLFDILPLYVIGLLATASARPRPPAWLGRYPGSQRPDLAAGTLGIQTGLRVLGQLVPARPYRVF